MKARPLNKRATIKYYYDYGYKCLIRQMNNKFQMHLSSGWYNYPSLQNARDEPISEEQAKELKPDAFKNLTN